MPARKLSATARPGTGFGRMGALLLGCTAIVAVGSGAARAQEDQVVLDTITIEGQARDSDGTSVVATQSSAGSKMVTDILDTPASVSVITAKELQDRGARSVEQVLQYTTGVTTDFYGSDERFDYFQVRGFDAYTYRDGLSLGRPFGGVREEPFAFDRVEVVKGANSSAFGISDPGGSVNYVSKRPRDQKFGEVYATAGSFDHAEVGFDFGDKLTQDGTLTYRLTGLVKDAKKEFDYSRDDEKFLMGGVTWKPSDATSVTIIADYLKRNSTPGGGGHPVGSNFDRSDFFGEPGYNFRDTDRKTLSVLVEHDFGGGLSFGSTLRYSTAKTSFGYAYIGATPTNGSTLATRSFFGNESENETFSADARLQYDTIFATGFGDVKSRTLGGLEYWDTSSGQKVFWGPAPSIDWTNPVYTGRPATVPMLSSQQNDQNGTGAYVQQELTFADSYILSLGLRHDWMDIDQTNRLTGVTRHGRSSETTHRAALTWKATNDLSFYGSFAQSVAPATLTVEPERGEQVEFGVKYRPEGMRALFSAAIYDLTKQNITVTNPATLQSDTMGKVRVKGLDLEARAELSNAISLIAGYSRMDSKIVENGTGGNVGNRIQFVPENSASLWATYTLDGRGAVGDMTFGIGARFNGSYYYNNANTIKTAGYTTFDASYTYQIRPDTSLAINVGNLFDKKVVAYGGFGADWYNAEREVTATLRRTW